MASNKVFTLTVLCLFLQTKVILCWPKDTYGLPMTNRGCPEKEGIVWITGIRTHQTEAGSFSSDDSHFAGTAHTEENPTDSISQYFCIKNSPGGEASWEPGQYCIYKVGNVCPPAFKEGSLYWDDSVDLKYEFVDHPVQKTSGELPQGEYGTNTKIEFCCRVDGVFSTPIHLPTELPFYLVRIGTECQQVEGMSYSVETIQWAGDHSVDADTGIHPLHTHTARYSRVYYCYYEEEKKSTTFKTVLIAILGVVAAIIFIAIIVFIIQRYLAIKKLKELEQAENNNTDPMLDSGRSNELSVIYKPGRGKKKSAGTAAVRDEEEGGLIPTAPRNSRPDSQPPSYDDVVGQES